MFWNAKNMYLEGFLVIWFFFSLKIIRLRLLRPINWYEQGWGAAVNNKKNLQCSQINRFLLGDYNFAEMSATNSFCFIDAFAIGYYTYVPLMFWFRYLKCFSKLILIWFSWTPPSTGRRHQISILLKTFVLLKIEVEANSFKDIK